MPEKIKIPNGTSLNVLFCDPGSVHTGWVVACMGNDSFDILNAGESNGLLNSADLVKFAHETYGVTVMVYEGFRLYEHMTETKTHSEFEEIQTIGAIRLEAIRCGLTEVKQMAYMIKTPPFSDASIRAKIGYGLRAFPSGHTRDAFRHLLYFWCYHLGKGYPIMEGNHARVHRTQA